jgi:hypothetical protein
MRPTCVADYLIHRWTLCSLHFVLLMSAIMSSHKGHKRKRGKNPMIEGDPDLAQAVTRQTISETRSDGTTVQRRVWVSIDAPTDKATTVEKEVEVPTMDYEPAHISPPPTEGTHSYRVCIYLNQASRIHVFTFTETKGLPGAIRRPYRRFVGRLSQPRGNAGGNRHVPAL